MAFVEECAQRKLTPEMIAWALNEAKPTLRAKPWRRHNLERVYMAMGFYIEFKNGKVLPLEKTISSKKMNLDMMEDLILGADYSKFEATAKKENSSEWCFGAADEESF